MYETIPKKEHIWNDNNKGYCLTCEKEVWTVVNDWTTNMLTAGIEEQ